MKVLNCKDVGMDCDFQARGRSASEVLKKAAAHATKAHGVKKVTKGYLESWRGRIHDE